MKILTKSQNLIGIDLGSDYIRIWSNQLGLMVNEPSLIAIDKRNKKVIAAGKEAKSMVGRVGKHIEVYRPFQEGRIYDFDLARVLIKVYLQRILKTTYFLSPVIMVSVGAGVNTATKKSIVDLFYSLGSKQVYQIAQPLAAAIGAGVPIADASGSVIFHMGASLVEAAVISLGSMVKFESIDNAGIYLDQVIKNTVKSAYELEIGVSKAEEIKREHGSVALSDDTFLLMGKDISSQSPKEIQVDTSIIVETLQFQVGKYEKLLKQLLSKTPAELTSDLLDKGLLLTGGLSQIDGLAEYLTAKLGLSVISIDDPELTVIKGIETAIKNLDLFRASLGYTT